MERTREARLRRCALLGGVCGVRRDSQVEAMMMTVDQCKEQIRKYAEERGISERDAFCEVLELCEEQR